MSIITYIIEYGIPIVIAGGASWIAYLNFIETSEINKINHKDNSPNKVKSIIIIACLLVTTLSSIKSTYNKSVSDRIAKEAQDSLKLKTNEIIHIQKENNDETKKLNDSLSYAKTKIISLQGEISNNIVGSNEPCYILFQTGYDRKGYPTLVNEGTLPIYDLTVYITDFNEIKKCKSSERSNILIIDESCYSSHTKQFKLSYIAPTNNYFNIYSLPDSGDTLLFEIRFEYGRRNIEFLEEIICKRQKNKIFNLCRLKILKGDKYEVLKIINRQKVDWKVDWDKIFDLPNKSRAFLPITWR